MAIHDTNIVLLDTVRHDSSVIFERLYCEGLISGQEEGVAFNISTENCGELASVIFISRDSLTKRNALKLFGMTDWEG